MTSTIKSTSGLGSVPREAGPGRAEQQGFHQRERPITPLFHFLSLDQQPNGHINNV